MKRIRSVVFVMLTVVSIVVHAQERAEFLKNMSRDKELKIGDVMPDILLGTVTNNYTGKTRFSDFRGKLVILDFWNSDCTTCMELFPYMDELQKEFGDRIQILLVNTWETQEQIDMKLRMPNLKRYYHIGGEMPHLPSIVNARELLQLFPNLSVPHHVWIDSNGIIRLIGSHLNTYPSKIRDCLEGRPIISFPDDNNTPPLREAQPYFKTAMQTNPSFYPTGSWFSGFDYNYAIYGGHYNNKRDSGAHVVRNTFVNTEIMSLYHEAFVPDLNNELDKTIAGRHLWGADAWLDYCELNVTDTLQYTSLFLPNQLLVTDVEWTKSRICYEQVLPETTLRDEQLKYMLTDLNRYFGRLYGTKAEMEKRRESCYIIVRTSAEDRLQSKHKEMDVEEVTQNGVKMKAYYNLGLKDALRSSLSSLYSAQHSSFEHLTMLDETNYTGKVDIILPEPENVNSFEDLKKALRKYDLDITIGERDLDMLVISEHTGYHP